MLTGEELPTRVNHENQVAGIKEHCASCETITLGEEMV